MELGSTAAASQIVEDLEINVLIHNAMSHHLLLWLFSTSRNTSHRHPEPGKSNICQREKRRSFLSGVFCAGTVDGQHIQLRAG